jgi:GT2 family glycosyltransferase
MTEKRCLVAICHNGPVVLTQTCQSLMELGWGNRVQDAKDAHGFDAIDFHWATGFPRVDSLRDGVAFQAVARGYSHLLFLDADMVWPTDVLTSMLTHHDQGIVSGLYHLKAGDYAPVAMRDGFKADGSAVTQYFHDRDYVETPDALRPQQVVGMGCTLVPTAVFEAIGPRPWFAYELDDEGWPRVSEDVPFCRKAREAGFAIWLDPSVKCGHVTTQVITEKWHRAVTQEFPKMLLDTATKAMNRPTAETVLF